MDNNINRHLPSHVSGTSGSTPPHPGNNSPLNRAYAGPSRSIQHTDSPSRQQQSTGNHPLANATAGSSRPRARGTHSAHPALMRNTVTDRLVNAGLDIIRRSGLTHISAGRCITMGYEYALKRAVEGQHVSHIASYGGLAGTLKKAMARLRDYPKPSDVKRFTALSESIRRGITCSTLDRVMAANNLTEVNSAVNNFCNFPKSERIGFNPNTIGNRNFIDVPLTEVLHTLVGCAKERAGIALGATDCSPAQLQHYKREILQVLADYSMHYLLKGLKSNLANIFVQQHRDISDRVMGINIKAIIEARKMQDTIKALDEGSQPLRKLMSAYLDNLQNQHAKMVTALQFNHMDGGIGDRIAAGERLERGFSVHEAQIKLVLQKLEGPRPPVEAVRAELKAIVNAYEDSFHFDYAKGPRHELNRDMNAVMGPIYAALDDFARSPRTVTATTIIPSLEQMIEAHNDVLRNFGVPEPQLTNFICSRQESAVELIRHILLDAPLPSGFVPYKCTQKHEFLDALPTDDGGALRIWAGSTAAVHQDYTGEEYDVLMEQVQGEFLFQHSQASPAPSPFTHAFQFDLGKEGREYRFAYRIETNSDDGTAHITEAQLSAFSPNKINEKIIVKLMPPEYRWPQLEGTNPQDRGERH